MEINIAHFSHTLHHRQLMYKLLTAFLTSVKYYYFLESTMFLSYFIFLKVLSRFDNKCFYSKKKKKDDESFERKKNIRFNQR